MKRFTKQTFIAFLFTIPFTSFAQKSDPPVSSEEKTPQGGMICRSSNILHGYTIDLKQQGDDVFGTLEAQNGGSYEILLKKKVEIKAFKVNGKCTFEIAWPQESTSFTRGRISVKEAQSHDQIDELVVNGEDRLSSIDAFKKIKCNPNKQFIDMLNQTCSKVAETEQLTTKTTEPGKATDLPPANLERVR